MACCSAIHTPTIMLMHLGNVLIVLFSWDCKGNRGKEFKKGSSLIYGQRWRNLGIQLICTCSGDQGWKSVFLMFVGSRSHPLCFLKGTSILDLPDYLRLGKFLLKMEPWSPREGHQRDDNARERMTLMHVMQNQADQRSGNQLVRVSSIFIPSIKWSGLFGSGTASVDVDINLCASSDNSSTQAAVEESDEHPKQEQESSSQSISGNSGGMHTMG